MGVLFDQLTGDNSWQNWRCQSEWDLPLRREVSFIQPGPRCSPGYNANTTLRKSLLSPWWWIIKNWARCWKNCFQCVRLPENTFQFLIMFLVITLQWTLQWLNWLSLIADVVMWSAGEHLPSHWWMANCRNFHAKALSCMLLAIYLLNLYT